MKMLREKENKGMKKVLLFLVLSLIMLFCVGCGKSESKAETIDFPVTVQNNTGVDIYCLYASVSGTDEWEEDILADEVLEDGDSCEITFTVDADSLVWDWKIEDYEGNTLEFYDLDFSDCSVDGAVLELEYIDGEGYATLN